MSKHNIAASMVRWAEENPTPEQSTFTVKVNIQRLPNEDGLAPHVRQEVQERMEYAIGSLLLEVVPMEAPHHGPEQPEEIWVSAYWDEDTRDDPCWFNAIRPGYSEHGKHIVVWGTYNHDGSSGFPVVRDETRGTLGWSG